MARYNEWGDELEAALAEPFPAAAHKTLKKGGAEITFVSVWDYVRRLNELVGVNGWHNVVRVSEAGGKLIMTCELTVLNVTKCNAGDEKEEKDDFGTASTNSWAQAFKRTCSLFGLGLYLYEKGGGAKSRSTSTPRKTNGQPSPEATPLPLDGSFIIPKGDYKDRRIDDPDIPLSYLFKTSDKMPPKYRAIYEAEIERRQKKAKNAGSRK